MRDRREAIYVYGFRTFDCLTFHCMWRLALSQSHVMYDNSVHCAMCAAPGTKVLRAPRGALARYREVSVGGSRYLAFSASTHTTPALASSGIVRSPTCPSP